MNASGCERTAGLYGTEGSSRAARHHNKVWTSLVKRDSHHGLGRRAPCRSVRARFVPTNRKAWAFNSTICCVATTAALRFAGRARSAEQHIAREHVVRASKWASRCAALGRRKERDPSSPRTPSLSATRDAGIVCHSIRVGGGTGGAQCRLISTIRARRLEEVGELQFESNHRMVSLTNL